MNIIQKSLLVGGVVAFTPQASEAYEVSINENKNINTQNSYVFINKNDKEELFKNFKYISDREFLTVEENILEISLNAGQNIPVLTGNPDNYTTIIVTTSEDKKLDKTDFLNLRNSGIPNIDLSNAYADEIPGSAFNDALFLKSFKFPKGVKIIDSFAFDECHNLTGELNIPDTVTEIGSYAFYECKNLTGDLVIPNTVTNIGYAAFYDCDGFNGTLTLSDSLTQIDDWVFGKSGGFIGDIIIPDNVTEIGENAFSQTGFTGRLVIGKNVRTIGHRAFMYCENLSEITTLGDSLEVINSQAFYGSDSIKGDLILPDSIKSVKSEAFMHCGFSGGQFYMPSTIEEIGDSAFAWSGSFTNGDLIFSDNLKSLGERAFELTRLGGTLVIPSTLTSIPDKAFYSSGLTGELVIPPNITSIGYGAFDSCSFTGDLIIPDTVTSIGESAFRGCSKFDGTLYISKNINNIPGRAFYMCQNLKGDIIIPDGVTSIGDWAFASTGFNGNIVIPDTVAEIGDYGFYGSKFKGDLKLPSSLTTLGYWSFRSCEGISGNIVIPESVTFIGEEAFRYCNNISGQIILPDGLETLGLNAFNNCSKLEKVIINIENYHIDSNFRKSIIDNLDESKLLINMSYDIDITGTWLENISSVSMGRPQLIGLVDKVNSRGTNISLYIPTPYQEENVTVMKDGKPYELPVKNGLNEYEFNEKGVYNINIITDSGRESNIKFTITDIVLKPSIEYQDGILTIVDNGHLITTKESLIENFEDSSNIKYDFSNNNWSIVNNMLKSQKIYNGEKTSNTFKVSAKRGDKLKIGVKMSSERNYDYGRIYINNIEVFKSSGDEASFTIHEFDLNEGVNLIRFEYSKDNTTSSFDDCMYINSIEYDGTGSLDNSQILEYKIGDGEWQLYTGPTKISSIDSNIKVQARMSINGSVSEIEEIDVVLDNIGAISSEIEKIETEYNHEMYTILRRMVNELPESDKKQELQNRLNVLISNEGLELTESTSNLDVYIKSENMLSMSLDTNNITFENFSGVDNLEKLNAVNLTISSSLPYKVDAYLATEMQNSNKDKTMNKEILNIKANGTDEYKTFTDVGLTPINLIDTQESGKDKSHGIDIMLKSNMAFEKDVYKTTLRFEATQK